MSRENTLPSPDHFIAPNRVLEVPMKSWAASDESHTVLFTHGLGPCIGLTVYDPATKKGFMGHIADPVLQQGMIEEMFDALKQDVSDPSKLKIWVRGGQKGAESEDEILETDPNYYFRLGQSNSSLEARKKTVEECIQALVGDAGPNVDIHYDESLMVDGTSTMQRLDTTTGEFVSHAYSAEEYQIALGSLSLSEIA